MTLTSKSLLFLHVMMIFIVPITMFHKTSELFEFNKIIIIYFISFASFIISLYTKFSYEKIKVPKILFLPFLFFLASQIFAGIFSIDYHTSFFGYYGRFNGGILSLFAYGGIIYSLIVFFNLIDKKNIQRAIFLWINVSMITSLIVVLWGLPGLFGKDLSCWLFTGIFTNDCWTDMFRPSERMFSTLGQPNWLGAYLVIVFFLSLGYFFSKFENKSFLNSLLHFFYFFLVAFGIFSTRSRSAVIAFLLLLIIWFALLIILNFNKYYKVKNIYLFIFFIGIIIVILTRKTGLTFIDKYIPDLFKTKNENVVNNRNNSLDSPLFVTDSFDIRKIVWKGAFEIIRKHPLLGTGPETFAYSYYSVRPREHNLTSEWDYVYNKAHNEFLHIFSGSGIVGFGAYLLYVFGMVLMMLYFIYEQFKKRSKYFLIQIGLLFSWLSIHITNVTGFSTTSVNIYFFTIPIISYYLYSHNKVSFATHSKRPHSILMIIILTCVFFYGLIRLIFIYFADLYYARAEAYDGKEMHYEKYLSLTKALQLHYEHVYEDKLAYSAAQLALIFSATEGSQSKLVKNFISQADKANFHTLIISPKNVFYWRTRAKIMYLFDSIDKTGNYYREGVKAIENAIRLAPTDPRLYYTYAVIESLHEGKSNDSINKKQFITSLFKQALMLKPNYRDARIALAEWYEKNKEFLKAKENYEYVLKYINPNDLEAKNGFLRN